MRGSSKANFLIAFLFVIGISLPITIKAFPDLNLSGQLTEKRSLAEWPDFSFNNISDYPERFENFFKDHFGLRDFLIHQNNFIRFKFFNTSGSHKVLVGKDDWLFFKGDGPTYGPLSNHLGLLPFGYEKVFERIKNKLEAKSQYLAGMGIQYIYVIAPDKWSVYPEYLPEGYANYTRNNNVDLLLDYLKSTSRVNILDLREKFRDSKHELPILYYKGGTHWNKLGAYFAYYEISKHLSKYFSNINPKKLDDFFVEKIKTEERQDLAKILSFNSYVDIEYKITPKNPYSYIHLNPDEKPRAPQFYKKETDHLPKALIFRDSFMTDVIPYMSDDFSFTTYIWSQWKTYDDIDKWLWQMKPNVVIEERVERELLPGVKL